MLNIFYSERSIFSIFFRSRILLAPAFVILKHMGKDFVHLHVHTEFSLLDGAARINDLVDRAKDMGSPALAITDHGAMYGVVDFFSACRAAGIKPIVGCEVYVVPDRFEKSAGTKDSPHHLILLAENFKGYQNLMHIVSSSYLDGFYYRPRTDKEVLKRYHEGIIATSSCIKGEIAWNLMNNGGMDKARSQAKEYEDIFGKGNFLLELQDQKLEGQKEVNESLIAIGKEMDIPVVATNDVHYVDKDKATAQDVLLCIQTGSTLEEDDRLRLTTQEFYLKSPAQMASIFSNCPEALENTLKVAERCNVEIDFEKLYLPHYEVPEGYDLDSYLERLSREGLKDRYPDPGPEVEERLRYELEVIKDKGFSGYFLVVWDFVSFAKKSGIWVGPGRGSAAGSLVSYCLGITGIDPLKYKLFFERFLNPERTSMPDIDIDFDDVRRQEVIDYVADKYGKDHVAQIITFGTLGARQAIRDVGRVFDLPYSRVDKIAKLIPEGPDVDLEQAFKTSPELNDEYNSDEDVKKVLDTAKALEGLARHDSIHAAGVVISEEELSNYTPLQQKGDGEIVTQYAMSSVQKIGLLKIDFLGLRTLTVIADTLKIVKRVREIDIDINDIPLDDGKTFKMLQKGDAVGVFQLESSGMRNLLAELQPTQFGDIVACVALFRPGPLGSGMDKDFIDRKHGRKPIEHIHESLEAVLKDTYGTIVYQEQVMQIAGIMAGFSMAEADILRAAMGKKKREVMAEQREKFIVGAINKGYDQQLAGEVFDLIAHFAGYGFNRAHATGYAMVAYQTAYLKANYPVEFMAALLTSVQGDKDRVVRYINECRRLNIEVLPPDINQSYRDFTVVGDSIRFGLSAIRNVGLNIVDAIIQARMAGPFESLYEFCNRVNLRALNKRALESLIMSGAFDFAGSRKYLLNILEKAIDAGSKSQQDEKIGQFSLFAADIGQPALSQDNGQDKEEFPKDRLLAMEKEMLGIYVSDHPLIGLESQLKVQTDIQISHLKDERDGSVKWIGGIVAAENKKMTKKGETMVFLTLEDLESRVEVVVFASVYQTYREILGKDKIILIKGRIDHRDNEVKMIAMEAKPLDKRTEDVKPLCLDINLERFSDVLLGQMKSVLKAHPGPSPVVIRINAKANQTHLELGRSFRVKRSSSLYAELKALLGEKAVTG